MMADAPEGYDKQQLHKWLNTMADNVNDPERIGGVIIPSAAAASVLAPIVEPNVMSTKDGETFDIHHHETGAISRSVSGDTINFDHMLDLRL